MFHVSLITVDCVVIGVVAQQLENTYRFYAVDDAFAMLENGAYDAVDAARSAAARLAHDLGRPARSEVSLA